MEKITTKTMTPQEYQAAAALIDAFIARTNKPNPKERDIVVLRQMLRASPMWEYAGQMAEHAVRALVEKGGATAFVQESMKEGVRRQREALALPSDGPLERLLVERAAVAWLALYLTEYRHAQSMANRPSIPYADHMERRLNGAHRRFTRACESLARVRKLARHSPVQVNVAASGGTFQQINVND